MGKIDRHGQAAILSQTDIDALFSDGFQTARDRALFGICLYTACRINEACSLIWVDVFSNGRVRSPLIIRKGTTKGKQATRSIPPHPDLIPLLTAYQRELDERSPRSHYLFPGRWGRHHIHPSSADAILREACARAGLHGISTHSFRRTALTSLSNAGVPLRVIQKISGHRSLAALQRYLDVSEDQVQSAIASMQFKGDRLSGDNPTA